MKMNEEAVDGERWTRKRGCENLDSPVVELCEKAAAMFLIARRNFGGDHLLKLEIRPRLNRVMHDCRMMAKRRQRLLSCLLPTNIAGLDFEPRLMIGLRRHQGDQGELVWCRRQRVPKSSQKMTRVRRLKSDV